MDHQGPVRHMSARSASQMHVCECDSSKTADAQSWPRRSLWLQYSPAGHHVKKNQCKHHVQIKVAWSQKFFSLLLKPKKYKKCQTTLPNTICLKKRCSGVWFGTLFFRFDPKWKKFWDYASFRIWSHKFQLLMYRKLFGPTVGKNRSIDQERLLKIRCWRPRIYNF